MTTSFELDSRLAGDTAPVTSLGLCRVLLMNDARYPWLVLVPARAGVTEIHDLAPDDRAVLIEEIARASHVLTAEVRPEKVNVGALGNIVRQLHVHIVARRAGDPAWPGPVWGHGAPVPYASAELAALAARLAAAF